LNINIQSIKCLDCAPMEAWRWVCSMNLF